MTLNEEIIFMQDLHRRTIKAIDDTYESLFKCEENVESLLKIAHIVFTPGDFMCFLNDCRTLDMVSGEFETSAHSARVHTTIEDSMDVFNSIRKLDSVFSSLARWVGKANGIIESRQFDVNKFMLTKRIDEKGYEYEVANYSSFEKVMEDQKLMFLVIEIVSVFDSPNMDSRYGIMNVLEIKGFEKRGEAYSYVLQKGLGRESVLTRF